FDGEPAFGAPAGGNGSLRAAAFLQDSGRARRRERRDGGARGDGAPGCGSARTPRPRFSRMYDLPLARARRAKFRSRARAYLSDRERAARVDGALPGQAQRGGARRRGHRERGGARSARRRDSSQDRGRDQTRTAGAVPCCRAFVRKRVVIEVHATTRTRELKFREALSEGLVQAMERDPSIFVTGIAVDYPSGIFGSTIEALRRFGPSRVFDAPAMENALTGIA